MAKKNSKLEKALKLAEETFGKKFELPTENTETLIREATAVANFYYSTDKEWYSKKCSTCGKEFFFSWTSKGVGYCSIACAQKALEAIGLTWNPNKTAKERWGRFIPAVVPPEAVKLVQELRPPDDIDSIMAEFEE